MDQKTDPFKKADLILKSLRGESNAAEEDELTAWLNQDDKHRRIFESFRNEEEIAPDLEFISGIDQDKAWQQVTEKVKIRKASWWERSGGWRYAAVILVLVGAALTLYQGTKPAESIASATLTPSPLTHDVAPGGNKARLILADGSEVFLENLEDGLVRLENGIRIIQTDGQISYQSVADAAHVSYNTLVTPKGGQYRIRLPDGSLVWLNAASSLRYPTAFLGKERRVILSGEGYFEVTQNKAQPFLVQTANATTEVLGTHFNVMAYPEDDITRTTLVEGSVKVSQGTGSKIMVPGQQATMKPGAGISLTTVDPEEEVAWKEGFFQFNESDLSAIIGQLQRWYDVEFDYEGDIPDGHFSGVISRDNNLSQVLHMLELSGSIKFDVEERRIRVLSKK